MQNHIGDLREQIINLLRALDCQKETPKYLIQQFYTVINIKTHQLITFLNEEMPITKRKVFLLKHLEI